MSADTKPVVPVAQTAFIADVLPDGRGGYTVQPHKPHQEISTAQARKLLGVARSTMWELRNDPVASKILKWRFTTPGKGKIMYQLASVVAYLEFTKSLED